MRFAFGEDELAFRDAVRDVLEKECTAADVRAAWEAPAGRGRWRRLAGLGVTGLAVPESHGGLGRDELALVLVLEECGRAAVPEPVGETAAVVAPLLRDLAPPEVRDRWLGEVASGEAIATVGLETTEHVAGAQVADVFVLQRGDELHAVAAEAARVVPERSLDGGRGLGRVEWEPGTGTFLVGGEAGLRAVERVFDASALAASAQLVGVAGHLVEAATSYARDRRQFGRPIGSFQAVKHLLADALLRLEFARPVVYRAAYSVAERLASRSVDVSMAKAYASDAASVAARVALQVHGAIGYTFEHDLHLWMKKAWALSAAWGDAAWHRERVASAVVGPAAGGLAAREIR